MWRRALFDVSEDQLQEIISARGLARFERAHSLLALRRKRSFVLTRGIDSFEEQACGL